MSPSSFHAASLRLPVPRLISCLGVFAFGLAGWLAFSVMEEERALEALFQENSQVIERAQAAEKWAQKGEEGIPRLREALVSSNSRVREYALLAFIYMPRPAARLAYTDLLPLCEDEVPSVQANALALVADLTDQPEKLAPLMASRLLSSSTDIVEAAQNGLDRLGPAAVPQIAKIFPQANPDIQEICLLLLMQSSHDEVMGLRARRTIGEAAQSPHAAVRTLAYQLISSIRPLSAREISAGLKDAQPEILKIALMQYANGVKPNLRDLPTLLKVLESERKFRPQVLEGLGQFPAAAETFSVILPWTDDENPAVRIAAMKALVRSADEPARAVPVLVRMVSDSHPRVSAVAGNLLAEADPNTAENVVQSVLLPRLQSDEPAVQIGAAGALSEMPQAAAHRLTLIRLLSAESSASPVTPMVQYQLAEALGNIGPLAQDAVPALLNLIQRTSPHDPLLIVPVTALGKIGYADRTVLDVLIRLHGLPQRHHGFRLHSAVIATLGKVGFGNKDVLRSSCRTLPTPNRPKFG